MDKKQEIDRDEVLAILRRDLTLLKEEFGVEKLAIYGSFAKGNPSHKSDVDILVQLSRPLGFGFINLAEHLEKSLGRKVDLATFNSLENSAAIPHRAHIAAEIKKTLVYA